MARSSKRRLTPNNFKKVSFDIISGCYESILKGDFNKAQNDATELINQYKDILKKEIWGKQDDKSLILICAIGTKAIDDYAEIGRITSTVNWFENTELVEKLWIKLWDCKERIEYVFTNFKGDLFQRVLSKVNELHSEFIKVYGNGVYASPEFLIKKETCSICNLDVRACLHISGQIYNGVICKYVVKDLEMRSISLVTVPKDPRCRAWAWNMEGRTIKGMAFFFNSNIDSFLKDDE